MTCIVGVLSKGEHGVLAADSCVSWKLSNSTSNPYVFADELQKAYHLSPNVGIALCGANVWVLQDILSRFRRHFGDRRVKRRFNRSGYERHCVETAAKRLIQYCWRFAKKRGAPATSFILASQQVHGPCSMWYWRSSSPKSLVSVQPEQAIVLGSAQDSPNTESLKELLKARSRNQRLNMPVDAWVHSSLILDSLHEAMAGGAYREVLVGGLFQAVLFDDRCYIAKSARRMQATVNGVEMDVQLEWNDQAKRFYQTNHLTGVRVPVIAIDQYPLQRISSDSRLFAY
jgi:hypothetical protein